MADRQQNMQSFYQSLFHKTIDFYQERWNQLAPYHQDHFAIRVLRATASDFFQIHVDTIPSRLREELSSLSKKVISQDESYTRELVFTGRYKHQNSQRQKLLLSNPIYLPLNDFIWGLYVQYQLQSPLSPHEFLSQQSAFLREMTPQLLNIFASRIINNFYCLTDVVGYSLPQIKQQIVDAVAKVTTQTLSGDDQSVDWMNNLYFFTHLVINESLFYTKYANPLSYDARWDELFDVYHDNIINSKLSNIKKIDALGEIVICLYLLNKPIPDIFFEEIKAWFVLLDDEFYNLEHEHTHGVLLLVSAIVSGECQSDTRPFRQIKTR